MQKIKFILISSLIILTLPEMFAEIADKKDTKQNTSTGIPPPSDGSGAKSCFSMW